MARQKLTDEERRSIRESHEQGISITALADRFGVAFNTIKRICYPELDKQQRAVSREYYNKNKQQIYETRKENNKRYKIELNKEKDADLISHLEQQGNIQGYIKQLISNDINKSKNTRAQRRKTQENT